MTADNLSDEELDALYAYREDPVGFAEDILGVDLWGKQKEILRDLSMHRSVAVASCHGAGKSFLGGVAVHWRLYCFVPGRVVTTAPTDRQVKEILWTEIRSLHQGAAWDLGGRVLNAEIQIAPKWSAIGYTSAQDATKFQGIHGEHIFVLVDEASGIPPQVRVGIDALLASGDAIELEIGNPTDPSSDFAKKFQMPSVAKHIISAFDTPNFTELGITIEDVRSGKWKDKRAKAKALPRPYLITPEWVRDKWEKWCGAKESGEASPLWKARVLGEFPNERPDQLIPLEWILAAGRRYEAGKPDPAARPRIVAVDVARFGDDETVVAARAGQRCKIVHATTGADTMSTVGRSVTIKNKLQAEEIRVDEIGMGGGVVDRLAELEEPVVPIDVSRASADDDCRRKRDEIHWNMRRILMPPSDVEIELDDVLTNQLTMMTYRIGSDGKIEVESKESMKKRLGWSPDRADAVTMAYAEVDDADRVNVGRSDLRLGETVNPRSMP